MSRLAARGRLVAVLGLLAAAGMLLGSSVLPWWHVEVEGADALELAGSDVAAGLVPLALTVAVLGLALTLARGVLARVLAVLAVLVAVLVMTHVVASGDASDVIEGAVGAATGITSTPSLATATASPVLAWVGAVLAAGCGAWVLVTVRAWARRQAPSRFDRVESGLAWDALDDGEDPTA